MTTRTTTPRSPTSATHRTTRADELIELLDELWSREPARRNPPSSRTPPAVVTRDAVAFRRLVADLIGDIEARSALARHAYRVLGLPHGASWIDVTVAYYDRVRELRSARSSAAQAAARLGDVNAAYTTLERFHRR